MRSGRLLDNPSYGMPVFTHVALGFGRFGNSHDEFDIISALHYECLAQDAVAKLLRSINSTRFHVQNHLKDGIFKLPQVMLAKVGRQVLRDLLEPKDKRDMKGRGCQE